MDNDNIHDVTYRFKICVSLDDDENALIYLERLVNYIEEYDYEELEIIHRLFKRLIHQKRKLLSKVIFLHKELPTNAFMKSQVLSLFTSQVHRESIDIIHRLLTCLNIALRKSKGDKSIVLSNKLCGKVYAFLYEYDDDNKTDNLQNALSHYQKAITLSIMKLAKGELLKYNVFLSYCKFSKKACKDYYRSMLFCINATKEIKEIIESQKDITDMKGIISIERKYEQFFEENIEAYNRVLQIYVPEIRKYV